MHEGGYGLTATDDGLFVFTRPNGRRVEENGANCFRGNILKITPQTSRCHWHGESMDYSQAIEAMQFLEQKAGAPEPLSG